MSLFNNAPSINTVKKAAGRKPEKVERVMKGMRRLAALDALMKSLKGMKETVDGEVKESMLATFVKQGIEARKRPENFVGREEDGTAGCELRIRSKASPLTDEEQAFLAEHNIPMADDIKVVGAFVINPEYASNAKLMVKVEKALMSVKGLPADFIQKQEEEKNVVVADNALDVLFADRERGENTCSAILPMISVLATKPKMDNDDISNVWEIVGELLGLMKKAK